MPLLIADGRVPLSAYGLMKRRLEALTLLEDVKLAWWDNYFDTCDGSIRHSDGRLKIVPDASYITELNERTILFGGTVPLSNDVYNSLVGEEFSTIAVDRYFNRELTEEEARVHPGWRALLRGDAAFQGELVDVIFAQAKERPGYKGRAMGLYVSGGPKEGAEGRLWGVLRFSCISARVGAFENSIGRLVGVAPGAQRAPIGRAVKATLEQRV
jgi:hypothetical protein